MSRPRNALRFVLPALTLAALSAAPARASITDLSTWSLVQDPPDSHFSAVATATAATLTANGGPIDAGTDIGYASVNGLTPATSTSGYAFDPGSSFSLAIDFDLSFGGSPSGTLGLGFGIGADRDGRDSAGAVLLTNNGVALGFGAAARVGDVNQAPKVIGATPSLVGTLFVTYNAASGDILLGVAPTAGAVAPTAAATYAGLQHNWSDGLLLASFFLRSDGSLGQPWRSGHADAVFSDLRVLTGTPVAVPEPASAVLVVLGGLGLIAAGRRGVGKG